MFYVVQGIFSLIGFYCIKTDKNSGGAKYTRPMGYIAPNFVFLKRTKES